jgi:membrane protease YdiL (CAAX protease family)
LSTPAARWGPAATLLWTFAVLVFFNAAQGAFLGVILAGSLPPGASTEAEISRLASNGDFLTGAIFIADPLCLLALFGIVRLKQGATIADSLAVVPPAPGWGRTWIPALLVFGFAADALTWMLGRPVVPEFMLAAWANAGRISLVIAVVLVAPIAEEAIFRGFLISGLRPTRLGASGAILVSALLWAGIHAQYDLYDMAQIFVLGLLLGAARVKTGSLVVTVILHILTNAIALVETVIATPGAS